MSKVSKKKQTDEEVEALVLMVVDRKLESRLVPGKGKGDFLDSSIFNMLYGGEYVCEYVGDCVHPEERSCAMKSIKHQVTLQATSLRCSTKVRGSASMQPMMMGEWEG